MNKKIQSKKKIKNDIRNVNLQVGERGRGWERSKEV